MSMLYSFLREDRLEEGAKDRYKQMFSYLNMDTSDKNPLVYPGYANIYKNLQNNMSDIVAYATKFSPAFVPWFLRWYRLYNIITLITQIDNVIQKVIPHPSHPIDQNPGVIRGKALLTKLDPLREKFTTDIFQKIQGLTPGENLFGTARMVYQYRTTFGHFYDLVHIPGVRQYSPEGKQPGQVMTEIKKIEDDYNKEHAGLIHPDKHEGTPVVEFPDGSAWFDLEKGGCPIEAQAMGHCGNGVGNSDETVLSYRVPIKRGPNTFWSPHLTFILNTEDGKLGEMKGRGNNKPSSKYHPQIVALLRNDIIKGIRGGGYLPENNFALADLSDDVVDQLLEEKPSLGGPTIWLRKFKKNPEQVTIEMRKEIQQAMSEAGINSGYWTKEVVPYWHPEENMWVVLGDKSGEDLVDEIIPKENSRHRRSSDKSLAARLIGNDLDFDNHGDYRPDSHELEDVWKRLSPEDKVIIGEYIKKNELEEYTDYVKSEFDFDEGEEIPDPCDPENDKTVIDYINAEKSEARLPLNWIVNDANRIGAESEAQKSLNKFLDDPSKLYVMKISPWDEPAVILVDTDSLIKLIDSIGMLEEGTGTKAEWLSIEGDVEEPHYGWSGYDLDTAMEMASDMIQHHLPS